MQTVTAIHPSYRSDAEDHSASRKSHDAAHRRVDSGAICPDASPAIDSA
jgi:hypothetical protein